MALSGLYSLRTLPREMQNQDNSGLSNAASSPPLVLAFLSIGLFGAGVIGVFAWRRLWAVEAQRGQQTQLSDKDVLWQNDAPKLWDMWTGRVDGPDALRWDNILVSLLLMKIVIVTFT